MAIHYPTLVSPTINPREWDAVVSFIQEYRLDIHEPGIIAQLQSINKETYNSQRISIQYAPCGASRKKNRQTAKSAQLEGWQQMQKNCIRTIRHQVVA